jgi:hypothetical protein
MSLFATFAMLGAGAACVAIDGGAVELAWTVRTEDARRTDCATQGIATVNLCLRGCDVVVNGACTGTTQCPLLSFPCDRSHGATDFSISPGRKELWITASCASGQTADVQVPESIIRDVSKGEVTQLNALLISVPSTGTRCGP